MQWLRHSLRDLVWLVGDDAARWTELAERAWTLLLRDRDVPSAAGQLVLRNDEDVAVTYPSLLASVRAAAARPNSGGAAVAVQPSPAAAPTATH